MLSNQGFWGRKTKGIGSQVLKGYSRNDNRRECEGGGSNQLRVERPLGGRESGKKKRRIGLRGGKGQGAKKSRTLKVSHAYYQKEGEAAYCENIWLEKIRKRKNAKEVTGEGEVVREF